MHKTCNTFKRKQNAVISKKGMKKGKGGERKTG